MAYTVAVRVAGRCTPGRPVERRTDPFRLAPNRFGPGYVLPMSDQAAPTRQAPRIMTTREEGARGMINDQGSWIMTLCVDLEKSTWVMILKNYRVPDFARNDLEKFIECQTLFQDQKRVRNQDPHENRSTNQDQHRGKWIMVGSGSDRNPDSGTPVPRTRLPVRHARLSGQNVR